MLSSRPSSSEVPSGEEEDDEEEDDEADSAIMKFVKKYLRTTDHYDGDKLFTIENGRKVLTPMLLVMVAIGPNVSSR